MINKVIPNDVLEDDGTIHLYLSSRDAAALANHTDITDIFVIQLDGAKDWLLCEESGFDTDGFRDKLDTCSTYNDKEISTLICDNGDSLPGRRAVPPKASGAFS